MRKLIFNMMITLDGFYARPNGDLDWHYADEEHDAFAVHMLDHAGALLFGRVTYEGMADYWPTAPSDPVADRMNALPKIVFSRTLKQVDWMPSRLIQDHVAEAVTELKHEAGKDLLILGSADLGTSLLNLGLVDEVQLMVCPILIGRGRSLFEKLQHDQRLKLVHNKTRKSGVVDLFYHFDPQSTN